MKTFDKSRMKGVEKSFLLNSSTKFDGVQFCQSSHDDTADGIFDKRIFTSTAKLLQPQETLLPQPILS